MKKILRGIVVTIALIFIWPWVMFKKYGNTNYKLTGKTVVISNHYATLDAFLIYLAFPKSKIRFVTIADTQKNIVTRFITWLFDCLYIDYNTANLSFFKQCIQILNDGGILCIYPEGVINPLKYGLFNFEGSFMYFAKKTGAKILPLYVYPELKFFKKSIVYVGDEVTKEEYSQFATSQDAILDIRMRIAEYASFDYENLQDNAPK